MKEYTTENVRNICLTGQRGSGKSSLADAIAFNSGVNNRIGRVNDGSSLMDYTDSELSRKTSLTAKLLAAPHKDTKINWFDTPGHGDFIGELLTCLRVAEAATLVISATAGVEVGTILQWNAMDQFQLGRLFFVNKMENDNVTWQDNLSSITGAFGSGAVPVHLPIGEASTFKGLVDVLAMKAYTYDDSGDMTTGDVPDDLKEEAEGLREKLVELAAEGDDALLEKFFEDGTLSDEDFKEGFRKSIASGRAYPILCGSADRNIGVTQLMDFVTEYVPNPLEMPVVDAVKTDSEDKVEIACDASGKPVFYIFKTVSESHLGELSLFKAYSGTATSGTDLVNQQTGNGERITQIYTLQGKSRVDLTSVAAGDVGALVKLKDSHTGNTLSTKGHAVTITPAVYPNPVMDVAIRAKSKGDEEKIATGLTKLREEDPTFRLVSDPALGQQVLYGLGPTHIEVLTEKLKLRFGVEVELGKPKIPYRETVKGRSEQQYRHKKQSGGRGQFGDVHIKIEPNVRGGGFEFIDEIKGGVIPSKFIPAVEKGVIESMVKGSLAGSQVVDVKVRLFYGSYHEVDSSDMAFKIAGLMAFREGFLNAKPVILEPICDVQVTVPEDYTGDVMGDLSGRRGKIAGMDPDGKNQIIKAAVPQAELYQYAVDLRSMTQGQGVYALQFSHYEEVPFEAAQKIIEQTKREKEEAE